MISILIPWRDDSGERRRLFSWVQARYDALLPEAEIRCADSGDEPFNRGASLNIAAASAGGDMFLVADADTFSHREPLVAAVAMAIRLDTWVLPYSTYLNLDQETTEYLVAGPAQAEVEPNECGSEFRLEDSVSGLIVLSRAAFEKAGGFPEKFKGWGYEDRAFKSAADTLIGQGARLPGFCFHLWHTVGGRFDQPDIRHNLLLAKQYGRAVGDPEAMRGLVNA